MRPDDVARAVLEASVDHLCITTVDGEVCWASPSWGRLLGDERLEGDALWVRVHPEDVGAGRRAWAEAAAGAAADWTGRVRDRHARWRWLAFRCARHEEHVVASARGVRGPAASGPPGQAAQQLEHLLLAERLSALGHWRIDLIDTSVLWSPQMFVIHGRDPARGEPTLDEAVAYYHPDDRAHVQAQLQTAMAATGDPSDPFEFRLVRDDGAVRLVTATGSVALRDGVPVALFGVFQDITERREVQRRLRRAERLASIGQLAAGVAHEVNNPLSYVHLNSVVLQEELRADAAMTHSARADDLVELVDDVRDGVERIQRIVAGLKSFSQAREGQRQIIEVGAAVRAAMRLCDNELAHVGQARMEAEDGELYIQADEGQVVQVVVNLVMNAVQAAAPDRALSVWVRWRIEGDDVVVEVEDTGVGMSDDVRQRVTEPFFTTKGRDVGTGLGLFVAQGIAEAHGGRLEVRSEAGVGSTMRLCVPRAHLRPVDRHDTPPGPLRQGAGQVLVIDDQPRVARAMARALRPHRVDVVTDPNEAIRRLTEAPRRYHVVLCDLMMPEVRGQDVYAAIPEEARRRMVFMTGGAFTPGSQDFAEAMGDRVLPKPPDRDRLRLLIEAALLFQE